MPSFQAGIRTPAKNYLVCLVRGKQRGPKKAKTKTRRGANSGETLSSRGVNRQEPRVVKEGKRARERARRGEAKMPPTKHRTIQTRGSALDENGSTDPP